MPCSFHSYSLCSSCSFLHTVTIFSSVALRQGRFCLAPLKVIKYFVYNYGNMRVWIIVFLMAGMRARHSHRQQLAVYGFSAPHKGILPLLRAPRIPTSILAVYFW